MHRHLRTLARAGALERRGQDRISGDPNFGLTPGGHELIDLCAVLRTWLDAEPEGGIELGSADAARRIGVLAASWSVGIARVLAAKPHSLAEVDRVIRTASVGTLERHLSALLTAGLIEPAGGAGADTRYQPTPWLRKAIAPLAAAAYWEQRSGLEDASPITRQEIESAFLLATPLVRLTRQLKGTCRLVVEVQGAGQTRQAGAFVTVEEGRVVSCVTRIKGQADSWISGSPTAWLNAVIEGDTDSLEVAGSGPLPVALLDGLHAALFGGPLASADT